MTRNCSVEYTAVTRWVDATLSGGTKQQIEDLEYGLYKAVQSGSQGQVLPSANMTG